MKEELDWIADIDSSKVNVLKFIQIMSAKNPGKYLIGKGKSNASRPYHPRTGHVMYEDLDKAADPEEIAPIREDLAEVAEIHDAIKAVGWDE